MVEWVKSIEFVDDIGVIGMGQGGYREDQSFYATSGRHPSALAAEHRKEHHG